jgi:hypothetical protein
VKEGCEVGAVDVLRTYLSIDVSAGAQRSRTPGFVDVQRICLLIDVSSGAQKTTGSGFMDVQRTCLLIDVSSGAQKITDSGFMDGCPVDMPGAARLPNNLELTER